MNAEPIVESSRLPVPDVRLEDERLEALFPDRGVSTGVLREVGDPGHLEPDQVVGVVRHTLGVGLGEADRHVGAEAEAVHARHSTAVAHTLRDLAALVRERRPCVVLTGAGISTESGIPDFRSPGGIWARYDPMEYATIDAFRRDPLKVWEFYALRLEMLTTAEPNAGHRALAELERRRIVTAVVTQNIDGLHERAGSRDVVEVHGSIRTASCLECGERVPLDQVIAALREGPAPRCPRCGAVLKPDVVMFGELLPAAAIDRATELARGTGLLLVIGSSLEVHPAAGLPSETVSAGGALAIVNRGPTPFDHLASVRIDGGAGETLSALAEALADAD
ncbi:MAG: NAD-dependent deacetylase [Gaiellaceae bacterium]|nr:NAD-dependent deacetylase [Gaiellaceae bacterium]